MLWSVCPVHMTLVLTLINTDIEDLTHKTGNFKQFTVFISMLESALSKVSCFVPDKTTTTVQLLFSPSWDYIVHFVMVEVQELFTMLWFCYFIAWWQHYSHILLFSQNSNSVSVDLLTYGDLESLRNQHHRPGFGTQHIPGAKTRSQLNSKRYLIMTYTVEFDRWTTIPFDVFGNKQ